MSRYVIELALADDPDRHPLVLTEEEQVELRNGIMEIQAFVRALRCELPGGRSAPPKRNQQELITSAIVGGTTSSFLYCCSLDFWGLPRQSYLST